MGWFRSCILFVLFVFISGCAQQTADLVPVALPQDAQLTCETLQKEIDQNEKSLQSLDPSHKKKEISPSPIQVSVTPWIYVHFSDKKTAEIRALERRQKYLAEMKMTKHSS